MARTEAAQPFEGGEMTLVEHLTELRKRLVISVLAVAIGMLVGFVLYEQVFDILIDPYQDIANSDAAALVASDTPRARDRFFCSVAMWMA